MPPLRLRHMPRNETTDRNANYGVNVRHDKLRFELVRRGWCASDLSNACGLSRKTVSAALLGKRIKPASLRRIVVALVAQEPVERIDEFL
jgi:lambda repressor-like predicted transcriptional regulator